MIIRDATPADAAAITALHNHNVRESTALWTVEETTEADRAAWIIQRQAAGFAVLVADAPGFTGYASYGPFRDKDGYDLTVENSVYVTPEAQGRGIARALMEALIEHARERGFHAMIGAVESANAGSLHLHRSLGFQTVGQMPQVGQKFGRWLDLTLVQLTLDAPSTPPG